MAINIQNIIAALEAKVAAATSATETQELIVLIKTIKASGQQTIATYATASNLPAPSADNAGNIVFVSDAAKLYYSIGTTWAEVGSGSGGTGGTAYDQSLNTTDDVVFGSGLIGDVTIIGNQIAGTDAYGNANTLELFTPVDFTKNVTLNSTVELDFGASNLTISMGQITLSSITPYQSQATQLLALPAMSLVTVTGLYSYATYQNTSIRFVVSNSPTTTSDIYNPNSISSINYNSPSAVESSTDGINWTPVNLYSGTLNFQASPSIVVSFGSATTVEASVASMTETGLTVDGQLNVTGGGDVVLDSALIGDVSIIGNQIAGIDSYGNTGTLQLSTPVEFTKTVTSGTPQTVLDIGGLNFVPAINYGTYEQYVEINGSGMGIGSSLVGQFTSIPSGTLVTTNDLYNYGMYESKRFRFVVSSSTAVYGNMYDPGLITAVRFTVSPGSLEYSTDGINWFEQGFNNLNYSNQNGVGTVTYGGGSTTVENTIVSVTDTGLVVVGDLTLADTSATPGSTSSPVKYAKVVVAGQTYYMPLFQ